MARALPHDQLPVARHQGIGRTLVESWISTLGDNGIRGCHLETFVENRAAVVCLRSFGFDGMVVPGQSLVCRTAQASDFIYKSWFATFRRDRPQHEGILGASRATPDR